MGTPVRVVLLGFVLALGAAGCTNPSTAVTPSASLTSSAAGKGAQNFQLRPVIAVDTGAAVACPSQIVVAPSPRRPHVACSIDRQTRYALGPALVTGVEVTSATPQQPANSPSWVIAVELTDAGSTALESATRAIYQLKPPRNQVAILVDGFVVSAPAPNGPVSGGVEISGGFTRQQAQALAGRIVSTP